MSLENDVVFIQRMMKLYEAEPVFKAAGPEDLKKRGTSPKSKYWVRYSYDICIEAYDLEDARYEFENIDLDPKDQRVLESEFAGITRIDPL